MENKKCKRLCNGYIQNQRINVWDMKELTSYPRWALVFYEKLEIINYNHHLNHHNG